MTIVEMLYSNSVGGTGYVKNQKPYVPAIEEYLKSKTSFHKGWEFLHIKDLTVFLVAQRVVWSSEIREYLEELGFEVKILSIAGYSDGQMRVLARPTGDDSVSDVKPFVHYPNYVDNDVELYEVLISNMKEDGILFPTTVNEYMFIRKDVNNYLKYYKCPLVVREGLLKYLINESTHHRGINRVLTNHYNPISYYVMEVEDED